MHVWRQTKQQLAGCGPFRVSSLLLTLFEVVINRELKIGVQLIDTRTMKDKLFGHVQYATNKNSVRRVVINASGIAAILDGIIHSAKYAWNETEGV